MEKINKINKKKVIIIIIIVLLVISVTAFITYNLLNNKTYISKDDKKEDSFKITLINDFDVEINSEASILSFINNKDGTYNFSGYNATIDDLRSEVESLVNKNWSIYEEHLKYVNEYRTQKGVSPLVLDRTMSITATVRAI